MKPIGREEYDEATWVAALGVLAGEALVAADLGDLLDRVAAVTRQLAGFDISAVLLVDEKRGALRMLGSAGMDRRYVEALNSTRPILLGQDSEPGEAPSSRAVSTALPIWVEDIRTHRAYGSWVDGAESQGFRTLVSVPLKLPNGVVTGTLNCYARGARERNESSIKLLEAMAGYTVTAMDTFAVQRSLRDCRGRLEDADAELARIGTELTEVGRAHRTMIGVALRRGTLDDLCDAVSSLLGQRQVVIEDRNAGAFASAEGERAGDALAVPILLRGVEAAVISTWAPPEKRRWALSVLEQAASAAALIMMHDRAEYEAGRRFRGDLVGDLISSDAVRCRRAVAAAQRAGRATSNVHVVVMSRGTSATTEVLAQLERAVSANCPAVVVGMVGDDLVALWPAGTEKEGVRTQVETFVRRLDVTAVIGPLCRSAEELGSAFRLARGASSLRHRDAPAVLELPELGIVALLLQVDDPHETRKFALRELKPIVDYDTRRGSDLMLTLRTYLDCGCRTDATASALFLHPNTVGQRLRRIEKLLGVSLGDPRSMLSLAAAVMVSAVADVSLGGAGGELRAGTGVGD